MDPSPTRGVLEQVRLLAGRLGSDAQTDAELLAAFESRRDEAALEALVRRYGRMVLGVCRRALGDEADAEDAFQTTFLILVRKASSIRDGRALRVWLHRVAVRAAREARAARRRRSAKERAMHPLPEPAAPPPADPSDLRPVLDEELDRLPEKYRAAVLLCDLEGKTRKEAAALLGVPPGTLSGRLTTAHRLLARRLARRGVVVTGGMLAALALDAGAEVPLALVLSTTETARAFAAGASVPASVAALDKGVLRAMLLHKIKVVALVVSGIVGLSVAAWAGASALDRPSDRGIPGAVLARPAPVPNPPAPPEEPEKPVKRTLTGHGGTARVLFSPDGDTLASFSDDRTVRIWDPRTGRLRHRLDGHTGPVGAAAFSPDGKVLATSDATTVRTWDVAKGEARDTLAGPLEGAMRLAFSPNGQTLACGREGGEVRIWDVANEKVLRSFSAKHPEGKPIILSALEYSPDGKALAVGTTDGHPGPSHLRLWDPDKGEMLRTLIDGSERSIWGAVFSADGKMLAVGDAGGTVMLFETKRWQKVGVLEGKDQLRSVAFASDNRTVAVGMRRDVQVWDVKTGERKRTLTGHGNWVLSVAFSPDGKSVASGSSDKTIRLWPVGDE